jgi:class 3 adenylate cyclase
VNVAARLQTECPPGGICVSRSVRDHVHGVSVGCWPPTAVPASVRSLVCHSEARQVSINE